MKPVIFKDKYFKVPQLKNILDINRVVSILFQKFFIPRILVFKETLDSEYKWFWVRIP